MSDCLMNKGHYVQRIENESSRPATIRMSFSMSGRTIKVTINE